MAKMNGSAAGATLWSPCRGRCSRSTGTARPGRAVAGDGAWLDRAERMARARGTRPAGRPGRSPATRAVPVGQRLPLGRVAGPGRGARRLRRFIAADKSDVATAYLASVGRRRGADRRRSGPRRHRSVPRTGRPGPRSLAARVPRPRRPADPRHPGQPHTGARLRPGARRPRGGRRRPAWSSWSARGRHAPGDRLPRHPVPAAGAGRHGPPGNGVPAVVSGHRAVLADHGRPGSDDRCGNAGTASTPPAWPTSR